MNNILKLILVQDIRDMFNTADKDRDGRISYQEFLVSEEKCIFLLS